MPQAMERIKTIEPSFYLPISKHSLNPALGESGSGLVAKQGSANSRSLTGPKLVVPESPDLGIQSIRQKHVTHAAILGGLTAETNTSSRGAVRKENIADIEPDDFGQAESGTQGKGEDDVVTGMVARGSKESLLFGSGESLGTQVRHDVFQEHRAVVRGKDQVE